jgi:hypothetical protein
VYEVTEKFTATAPSSHAPGEHYRVEDPARGVTYFRVIAFYRTPRGGEVAVDGTGCALASDGGLFREVKAAVERYDEEASR